MCNKELSDIEITKILLNDCLELKIEDAKFAEKPAPDLNRIFHYTHIRFGVPETELKSHPLIKNPIEFAIFLFGLETLKDSSNH